MKNMKFRKYNEEPEISKKKRNKPNFEILKKRREIRKQQMLRCDAPEEESNNNNKEWNFETESRFPEFRKAKLNVAFSEAKRQAKESTMKTNSEHPLGVSLCRNSSEGFRSHDSFILIHIT